MTGHALKDALPFWLSLPMLPLAAAGAAWGGLWVVALPAYSVVLVSLLDALTGLNEGNADPETPERHLFLYRIVTLIWFPMQAVILYGTIWWVTRTGHLGAAETIALFFGIGIVTGTVGIVYAHELMHQRNRAERWLADLLLATVLYSHFRSEHLRVHHIHVGTPRDPVTAPYNEGFHRFFPRVLWQCLVSSWKAEVALLARKDLPWWNRANPFWRYAGLQALALVVALAVGGWAGLALFVWQALVAIWQLEAVNYVEHYGLTRKHLGNGRYEPVRPHHSWNASHAASNWLLINLQRHSDHHTKPDRRFPLLQTHGEETAPQLPFGYPIMVFAAQIPPVWRRMMNPRVRAWRRRWYPEVEDWTPAASAAMPAET